MNVEDISDDVLQRLEQRRHEADTTERLAALQKLMTPAWQASMDEAVREVRTKPAAVQAKVRKIYRLVDRTAAVMAPLAACKSGCNACCHVQVEILDTEAKRIAAATGRSHAALPPGRHTTPAAQLGRRETPCPFLVAGKCSIYEDRPYVCRELMVLDRDALTCGFENIALGRVNDRRVVRVPCGRDPDLRELFIASVSHPRTTWADIRQWFPAAGEGASR